MANQPRRVQHDQFKLFNMQADVAEAASQASLPTYDDSLPEALASVDK